MGEDEDFEGCLWYCVCLCFYFDCLYFIFLVLKFLMCDRIYRLLSCLFSEEKFKFWVKVWELLMI